MNQGQSSTSEPWWVVFARIAVVLLLVVAVGENQQGAAAIALAVLIAGHTVSRAIRDGR